MKVRIFPNKFLNPGMVHRLLAELGAGPVLTEAESVRCELTQAQLDLFQLKGASHRVEVLPDAPPAGAESVEPESLPVSAAAPAAENTREPEGPPTIIIETAPGRGTRRTIEFPKVDPLQPVEGAHTPVEGSQSPVHGSQAAPAAKIYSSGGPNSIGRRGGRLFEFHCPGCKVNHPFEIGGQAPWKWNGSTHNPTFTPSLRVNEGAPDECHLTITDGKILFHPDSKHDLAGQTVEMLDW